jgi:hypothetical protein
MHPINTIHCLKKAEVVRMRITTSLWILRVYLPDELGDDPFAHEQLKVADHYFDVA